ncbi:MAG TPA: CHRD domain-containing protein [Candidatus Solibacter sp.]|nr:CHRD domain-containing protein [Candidatus Solibacter sp.]
MFAASANAGVVVYTAFLNGPAESPPNGSPGTGFAEVDVDNVAQTMRVQVSFSGLTGTTTASHIHSATATPGTGTAIVATQTPSFTGFPLGVTSGTYDNTFDLTLGSTYNPAFITANGGTVAGAEAALLAGLTAGEAYLNIHSTTFGGGEIRGFLQAQADVPEPGTFVLAGAVVAGLFLRRRKK